jgi:hypothetical protein
MDVDKVFKKHVYLYKNLIFIYGHLNIKESKFFEQVKYEDKQPFKHYIHFTANAKFIYFIY